MVEMAILDAVLQDPSDFFYESETWFEWRYNEHRHPKDSPSLFHSFHDMILFFYVSFWLVEGCFWKLPVDFLTMMILTPQNREAMWGLTSINYEYIHSILHLGTRRITTRWSGPTVSDIWPGFHILPGLHNAPTLTKKPYDALGC